MSHICFRIHLKDDVEINFVACGCCGDGDECFAESLAESRETGFLELGSMDSHMFIIPTENIAFIERISDYDMDEDD